MATVTLQQTDLTYFRQIPQLTPIIPPEYRGYAGNARSYVVPSRLATGKLCRGLSIGMEPSKSSRPGFGVASEGATLSGSLIPDNSVTALASNEP